MTQTVPSRPDPDDDPRAPQAPVTLTAAQQSDLVATLRRAVAFDGCDDTLRATNLWAGALAVPWSRLRRELAAGGGHCDCEVLHRVFRADEEEPC